jgi:hypothetical protein
MSTAVEPVEEPRRPKTARNPNGAGRIKGGKNKPGHHAGRPKGSRNKPLKESNLPSVWHNGRAEISVEQRHIDRAMEKDSSHCAVADAIKAQVPEARFISIDLQTIRWTDARKKLRYVFLTPSLIQTDVIIPFDQGERDKCRPTVVKMKPAYVCQCGKKRRHTPDNEELKDLNLRVAKDQPHIAAQEPDPVPNENMVAEAQNSPVEPTPIEAAMVENWKPDERDPWKDEERRGKPRDPDQKPRKPRQARAKVSSVTKGDVPVTLGGALPPVSVLARREFGLRVLSRREFGLRAVRK